MLKIAKGMFSLVKLHSISDNDKVLWEPGDVEKQLKNSKFHCLSKKIEVSAVKYTETNGLTKQLPAGVN